MLVHVEAAALWITLRLQPALLAPFISGGTLLSWRVRARLREQKGMGWNQLCWASGCIANILGE